MMQGIEIGELKGIERGIEKGVETVAMNMLMQNLDASLIAKTIGFSFDKINQLKIKL